MSLHVAMEATRVSGERKGDGGYVIVKPTNSIVKAEQERKPERKTVWCLLRVMLNC